MLETIRKILNDYNKVIAKQGCIEVVLNPKEMIYFKEDKYLLLCCSTTMIGIDYNAEMKKKKVNRDADEITFTCAGQAELSLVCYREGA